MYICVFKSLLSMPSCSPPCHLFTPLSHFHTSELQSNLCQPMLNPSHVANHVVCFILDST